MVANGEHEKISIGRVLVSGSTPHLPSVVEAMAAGQGAETVFISGCHHGLLERGVILGVHQRPEGPAGGGGAGSPERARRPRWRRGGNSPGPARPRPSCPERPHDAPKERPASCPRPPPRLASWPRRASARGGCILGPFRPSTFFPSAVSVDRSSRGARRFFFSFSYVCMSSGRRPGNRSTRTPSCPGWHVLVASLTVQDHLTGAAHSVKAQPDLRDDRWEHMVRP